MYKTILVPLDGSKRAEAIMPYVESLAACFGARVILLQVVEPHSYIVGPDHMYPLLDQYVLEERTQEAEIYLASQQSKLQQKDISSQVCIAYGPTVAGITKAAEREGAELIAMASHGRTGLARAFYGSVAA
ncbi:MAG TPA: universal stress protein, partial [Anaerolineae bacterium]|nr:universal stress protein [Anaerolineae bacterium]